jgi:putative ABC transport system substrate-binding protein
VRIGFLSNFTPSAGKELVGCFTQELAKGGWVEGKNLLIEYRWAGGNAENYPRFATELSNMNLDLIAVNSTPAAQAMRKVTPHDGVPVVFMSVSDPVESGIVESIPHPGANITGVSNFFPANSAKLLELIRTVVPEISKVIVIRDAANPGKTLDVQAIEQAARSVGVTVVDAGVRNSAEIKKHFLDMEQARPDALIILVDGVTLSNRDLILQLIDQSKIPAIYQVREFVDAGGFMSYGLDFCQHFARAAAYADNILRGAKPADLPIELPTTFQLVINMRAAKLFNLVVPSTLTALADEVIE